MVRPRLEVGDVFRDRGGAYRRDHAGHLSLGQLKVMSAVERCRTRVLGGHRLVCDDCGSTRIAYNSCRNRHCPKCQGNAAEQWLADRQRDLLPIEYYHAVFTVPTQISDIAYQNKAIIYDLMFKAAAETLQSVAAKHLGAKLGVTAVLHTWGSAMTHHPHIHCIVTGGGLSLDGESWVACRSGYLLPHKVLSNRFRTLLLKMLHEAHREDRLRFFGEHQHLAERKAFIAYLAPLVKLNWYVHIKAPFAGPEAVLEYLGRYTHRVALANSRLIAYDGRRVTFWHKDYRGSTDQVRYQPMTLEVDEFLRRFLIHILPKGFHRIRHYGVLASHVRAGHLAKIRTLLDVDPTEIEPSEDLTTNDTSYPYRCRDCGGVMVIVESFEPTSRDPPMYKAA